MPRIRRQIGSLALVLVMVALAAIAWALSGGASDEKPREDGRPIEVVAAQVSSSESSSSPAPAAGPRQADPVPEAEGLRYVGSAACAECHEQEHELWLGSHHDLAMQVANEKTVLGDFSDVTFEHFETTSRFFRRGDRFVVHTDGPDGVMRDYEIDFVFGVEPLQQYLVTFDDGRVQCLPLAWDTIEKRWFHLYPDEPIPHDDILHWTRPAQNWNHMCADCHSTDLRKNYDVKTHTFNTRWAEMNVGCEACHGRGSEHLAWAESQPPHDDDAEFIYPEGEDFDLEVLLKDAPNTTQINACAPCHSRRYQLAEGRSPGDPFMDNYQPELLHERLYHADGQILDEVYVYGSFVQSKMFHEGVKCSNCHDPHTLKLREKDNALCLQCHQPEKYDTTAHHFHESGTESALCVNCHMPGKYYMVVDFRRDHSLRVPRPDLTVKLGTPNACNDCHDDKTAQWAADAVVEWYGPTRAVDPHYAEAIAAGRAREPEGVAKLVTLAANKERPAIARATAVWLLRQYSQPQATQAIIDAARDEDPLVRRAAVEGLDRLPAQERARVTQPLLEDPLRAVRIEAARMYASAIPDNPSLAQVDAFEAAREEFERSQRVMSDQPGAHLNLGVMQEHLGATNAAILSYLTAMQLDENFTPAIFNLATLYNRLGKNHDAEMLLRRLTREQPEMGEAFYSLGLLLAESPARLDEATDALREASRLMPERVRVHYNLGLALQHQGRIAEAQTAFLRGLEADPNSGDVLYALTILHMQQGQWSRAMAYARRLKELFPQEAGLDQLIMQIEAQGGGGPSRPGPP